MLELSWENLILPKKDQTRIYVKLVFFSLRHLLPNLGEKKPLRTHQVKNTYT